MTEDGGTFERVRVCYPYTMSVMRIVVTEGVEAVLESEEAKFYLKQAEEPLRKLAALVERECHDGPGRLFQGSAEMHPETGVEFFDGSGARVGRFHYHEKHKRWEFDGRKSDSAVSFVSWVLCGLRDRTKERRDDQRQRGEDSATV